MQNSGNLIKSILGLATIVFGFLIFPSSATPPEYATFKRDQRVSYEPAATELLRIWMVYVGQGDGILIQLPPKYNYESNLGENPAEGIEILIDGGSFRRANASRMLDFLLNLYGPEGATIEHAVISHHDQDHVLGLIEILDDSTFEVQSIYHNGLASYKPGKRNFPATGKPDEPAIYASRRGRLTRGMAFLESDGERMKGEYLIDDLDTLRERMDSDEFQGVYRDLVSAVLNKTIPTPVSHFDRVSERESFVSEREIELGRPPIEGIQFELIWPLNPPRKYGDWGETINGNSVTFRLVYGDFEMLFTGDHNEKSEEALLEHLSEIPDFLNLTCDVLKVPHHGSDHAFRSFFQSPGCDPVVSVASQGEVGARSKNLVGNAWQHPSTEVISWLGGAHRVYHTQLHERRFSWEDLETNEDHERLYERTHILIETDGHWFRIVEIEVEEGDINSPPTVTEIRRSNGTRWIKAK